MKTELSGLENTLYQVRQVDPNGYWASPECHAIFLGELAGFLSSLKGKAVGTRLSEAGFQRLSIFGPPCFGPRWSLTGEGPHLLLYEERLRDWSLYAYEYRFSLGEGDRAQVACS